ncbi:MAG: L-serine ammonia-lyase, iron-sulfur-dependent, subunit alpha [Acholeplasmataceae bacterium]
MLSLRSLYQIGYGPSSSHTMGPAKACRIIRKRHPDIDRYAVVLYNSFALTGTGHLTKEAITETLAPVRVNFSTTIDLNKHPNTMRIEGYLDKEVVVSKEAVSVGGGRIVFSDEKDDEKRIYPHDTFKDIKAYCKKTGRTLVEYVLAHEDEGFADYLKDIWRAMRRSIERGLVAEGVLPGPLGLKRKASDLFKKHTRGSWKNRLLASYALAVSEENASGNIIVTAPTCGACGVVPAVLYHAEANEERIVEALAVAGIIGNLIKHNASISGAVAGCQAEIGSACSMAAAAWATLENLSPDQVEYAAEIAMEHHLGLTCDPVNGYVQIPCIERNAVAALRAVDAAGLSYYLTDSRKVSFDTVVRTMYQTGLDLSPSYKETSQGGLAYHYKDEDDVNCW